MPWIAKAVETCLDGTVKVHKVFLNGRKNITALGGEPCEVSREMAQAQANQCLRNWKQVGPVEYTSQQTPINPRPLPGSAHEFGILKAINNRRRR